MRAPRRSALEIPWYHGTSVSAANAIVKSQVLIGDGDFGVGGYLTSDLNEAQDHSEYYDRDPAIVLGQIIHPHKPLFGGKENPNLNNNPSGHDIWFPHGRSLDNPGSLAVLLTENARNPHGLRPAQFSRYL